MIIMACLPTAFITLTAQEIAIWDNWCRTAVTFTFDDGGQETNSHTWAAERMDQYGFKGTFFLVTNWCDGNNSWNEYKSIAENGHEIGSHTVSHPSNCRDELDTSKEKIESKIGQPCLTIAYSNCNHPGSEVLNYYIGGRICSGGVNSSDPANLSNIDAIICGTNGVSSEAEFLSKCTGANNGWVVFLIHGIQGHLSFGSYSPTNETTFLSVLYWLQQNKSTFWVTTMRDAIMYIKERNSASFTKYSENASRVTYKLTLPTSLTSNTLCNWDYPLSLRVPLPSGWSDVTVKQNSKTIESEIKDGKVYFKAVPNGGNIVLTKKDGISTNVESIPNNPSNKEDSWYTIDGVRQNGRPNTSGVYIHNGKTVIR